MAVETEVKCSLRNSKNESFSNFLQPTEPLKVHNHLLDTQIYATLAKNDVLQTIPSTINFQGFVIGKSYTQKLRIINMSNQCQRMHIIPPSSEEFKISYKKIESLVPGMYLEVTVTFKPMKNEPYHDSIRIHSEVAANLIVPIHAYFHFDVVSSFPSHINFKPTIVGQMKTRKVILHNPAATDFEFQINFLQKQTSFIVKPLAGVIPANDKACITVSYSPTDYCTSCAKLQVQVYQFNSFPHVCTLTGSSEPGLATKLKQKELENAPEVTIDPRLISPLGRSRAKKSKVPLQKSTLIKDPDKGVFEHGIHFPKNLNTPAAVGYVLTQQPGKMKAKDIRKAIEKNESTDSSKQLKEAVFEKLVHENISEEERNQLRWCVRLGESPILEKVKQRLLKDRDKGLAEFKINHDGSDSLEELSRSSTCKNDQRILRQANEQPTEEPSFDLYLNDDWETRHRILKRFIEAGRKVIIRQRVTKNLKSLSNHLDSWRRGNFMSTQTKIINKEQEIVDNLSIEFDKSAILSLSFPKFPHPNSEDDMAVDALGVLPVPPTVVHVKSKIQTYQLKVPQQYKLLSYNRHSFTSSVNKYIPKKLSRELRTGAENEIIQMDDVMTPSMEKDEEDQGENPLTTSSRSNKLTVPKKLLEPKNYHPMHIFNPMPGVQAHPQPLPYSEIDPDYNLSPLPLKGDPKIDRHDLIPGVLLWKKFPSHGLIAMNQPNFSSVYVPRRTDPFGEEMMSTEIPTLLTCLPEDDVMDDCDNEERIIPTMEMIRKEFKTEEILKDKNADCEASICLTEHGTLPPTNNPICRLGLCDRETMQQSFDVYLQNKQDALGERIRSNLSRIQSEWGIH